MHLPAGPVDLFLHLDHYLGEIIAQFGNWTYGILFAVIFLETGVVVTPFLPGDSLLFAAGALAASTRTLDPLALWVLLFLAAVLGDAVNYRIGQLVGPRAFDGGIRWLKRDHLERTHRFYEKYGGKTVFLARFVPIVRTFAPFVAGVGLMSYRRFFAYNVFGGLVWTAFFVFGGYYFGNLPAVKENFSFVVLAIIFLSILPPAIDYLRYRREKRALAG